MKINNPLKWIIVAILLFVDLLTFHDIFQSHTIRDWFTLLASILVFIYFAKDLKFK